MDILKIDHRYILVIYLFLSKLHSWERDHHIQLFKKIIYDSARCWGMHSSRILSFWVVVLFFIVVIILACKNAITFLVVEDKKSVSMFGFSSKTALWYFPQLCFLEYQLSLFQERIIYIESDSHNIGSMLKDNHSVFISLLSCRTVLCCQHCQYFYSKN